MSSASSYDRTTGSSEYAQIQKYGGFYVGRYEAGVSTLDEEKGEFKDSVTFSGNASLFNAVTAGTAKGDDSRTLGFGGTFTVPSVTYDAQGHITGKGSTTMTMPSAPTSVSGNAGSATKLANARNFSITGGVTAAAVSFNGTADVALNVTSVNAAKLTIAESDTLILDGSI